MMPKFCIDCKYHEMGGTYDTLHVCSYGNRRDMVTGEKAYRLCETERNNAIGDCRKIGKHWDLKK